MTPEYPRNIITKILPLEVPIFVICNAILIELSYFCL